MKNPHRIRGMSHFLQIPSQKFIPPRKKPLTRFSSLGATQWGMNFQKSFQRFSGLAYQKGASNVVTRNCTNPIVAMPRVVARVA